MIYVFKKYHNSKLQNMKIDNYEVILKQGRVRPCVEKL